ncbi:MAG: diaminopimelate epimerase [Holosporaceae bacterium]|jgi:diaminopimelate epimerase|nr:diaminopimelate epimerase [Holosporaceae bacterium]
MIKFDKMQSNGNDFVMVDETQLLMPSSDIANFCVSMGARKIGVGCDLVTLYNSDAEMIRASFFNSDGSAAEICGNAACCLAMLMKIKNNCPSSILKTKNKTYELLVEGENTASVNFGCPDDGPVAGAVAHSMPQNLPVAGAVAHSMPQNLLEYLEGKCSGDRGDIFRKIGVYHISCLSVGNPHLVLLVKDMPSLEQAGVLGAFLEKLELFPQKINVSFAKKLSNNEIELLVFERAEGLTLACGSGAVAAVRTLFSGGFTTSTHVVVHQRGGSMTIRIEKKGNIILVSSAVLVFSGVYYPNGV